MQRHIGIAVLILAAILAAGCGSNTNAGGPSSKDSQEPIAMNKGQFIKQGNAVCAKGLEEKDEAVRQALEESTERGASEEEAGKRAAEAALPVFRKMVHQLREVRAPAQDRSQVDQILVRYEAALDKAEAAPSSLVSGNPFMRADRAATSYGLKSCNA